MGTGGLHAISGQATNQKAAVMVHVSDLSPRSRWLALLRCSFRYKNSPFGLELKYFFLFFLLSRSLAAVIIFTKQHWKKLTPTSLIVLASAAGLFLAIAREFRGNGILSPGKKCGVGAGSQCIAYGGGRYWPCKWPYFFAGCVKGFFSSCIVSIYFFENRVTITVL